MSISAEPFWRSSLSAPNCTDSKSQLQSTKSHINSREQELSRQEWSFLQRPKYWCLQDRQGPSWSSFNHLSSKRTQPELSLACLHHSFSVSSRVPFNQLHYFVWTTASDLAVILSELLAYNIQISTPFQLLKSLTLPNGHLYSSIYWQYLLTFVRSKLYYHTSSLCLGDH